MHFHRNAVICRHLPFKTDLLPPAALVARTIAPEAPPPTVRPERRVPPQSLAPRWFQMVQGDVSLNRLFR